MLKASLSGSVLKGPERLDIKITTTQCRGPDLTDYGLTEEGMRCR
jgi:hypothetical protein